MKDKYFEHLNCPQVNATRRHGWLINIASGNGLVPSGTKPLPEPVLTQIYVNIWCHQATMSWYHIYGPSRDLVLNLQTYLSVAHSH